jgi:threonylcarbamoyladenosine tRNA methylthiotransferase MtaB
MPKVEFITFGCKVNQYETQLLREQFLSQGFSEINSSDQSADYYIINTCTVTARADKDVLRAVDYCLRRNSSAKILLTGCCAETFSTKLLKENSAIRLIPNSKKGSLIKTISGFNKTNPINKISFFSGHSRAFVKVQDGCNNFCSFCKIPYVRGRSKSRKPKDVLEEIEGLLIRGYKEIILTGICLGRYGKDLPNRTDLVALLKKIISRKYDFRIRLSSIELTDINKKLIKLLKKSKKICKHLHIPLQSGDNAILKLMHRPYNSSDFIKKVRYIRKTIPNIAISTDILLGFPYEKKENFNNTLNVINQIKPMHAHIFIFSPRPGTAAFKLWQDSPKETTAELKKRRGIVINLTEKLSLNYRKLFINKKVNILVESKKPNKKNYSGYSDNYIHVYLNCKNDFSGRLLPVIIRKVTKKYTIGKPFS